MKQLRKTSMSVALVLLAMVMLAAYPGSLAARAATLSTTTVMSTEEMLAFLQAMHPDAEVILDENGEFSIILPTAFVPTPSFERGGVVAAQASQNAPEGGIWTLFRAASAGQWQPREIRYLNRANALTFDLFVERPAILSKILNLAGSLQTKAIQFQVNVAFALSLNQAAILFGIQLAAVTAVNAINRAAFRGALNQGGGVRIVRYEVNGHTTRTFQSWRTNTVTSQPYAHLQPVFRRGA